MIAMGGFLIADRSRGSVWVPRFFSPLNAETAGILKVVAGVVLIGGGISMIAGN